MNSSAIEKLETSLESPPNAESDALANELATILVVLPVTATVAEREQAVRGLVVLNHYFYRIGNLARSTEMLVAADELSVGLDGSTRVGVLLRRSEQELLLCDLGGALSHTAAAMELGRLTGNKFDEARAWTNYAMALQAAGLFKLADVRLSHALVLLGDDDAPRLRGNIWALRSQLGCFLEEADFRAAAHACEQSLRYADASPVKFRDSMACTALCNFAALEILRNHPAAARRHLEAAGQRMNLGARPRWLIAMLSAMLAVREHNGAAERDTLDKFLAPDRAPARAYVIETYSVLASMYAAMGDGEHACDALEKLSAERASALWATLSAPNHALLHADPKPDAASSLTPPQASVDLLERLAVTAELRDDATGRHCYRVGKLSMLLAQRANESPALIAQMECAARLHDIGKFAIPDAVLLKPGPLSAAETRLMRTHCTIGAELLARSDAEVLIVAEQIARHHHEHWDGSGYPAGLKGEAIPIAARITALADVYDALTHARPYKLAWSHADAMVYIKRMRGTQFDPRLTDLLVELMALDEHALAGFLASLGDDANESPYVVAEDRFRVAMLAA